MNGKCLALRKEKAQHTVFCGTLSNIEKIISAILPWQVVFYLLTCLSAIFKLILSTLLKIECVADDFGNVVDFLEGVEHIDVHHVFGLFIEGLTRL